MNRVTVRIAATIFAATVTVAEMGGIALLANYEVKTAADGGNSRALVATVRNFTCGSIERWTCCQPCTHMNADRGHGSVSEPRR